MEWGDVVINQSGWIVLLIVALVAFLAPEPVHEAFNIWRARRLPRPPAVPRSGRLTSASPSLPATTARDGADPPARSGGDSGRSIRLVIWNTRKGEVK